MEEDHGTYERYLKGTLPDAERAAFEQRLTNDALLAQDFQEFRTAYDAVMLAGEAQLRTRLHAIHDAQKTGSGKGARVLNLFPTRWLALAASVVLALVTSYLLLNPADNTADLFAEHMVAYSGPDRLRSDSVHADDPWMRFTDLYNLARYDEALRELDVLPVSPVPDYLRAFYRGQCLLLRKTPDPQAAMSMFQQVLDTDNDLHTPAHWYMALAALKADDVAVARTHLEKLVEADRHKSAESRELLEALP